MNILLVSTYGFDARFPSRPEILQARALARRGHHVVAYEYYDPRQTGRVARHEWLPGNVALHRCRTWGFFSPDALARMLAAERPDIVHIHHLRNLLAFQTARVARLCGWPVVLTPHGLLHDGDLVADRERPLDAPLRFDNLITSPRQLIMRLLRGAHPRRAARNYLIHAPLRLIDGAVALSQHERDLLMQLGVPPERITVLPNAVDLSSFDEGPTTNDERASSNGVLSSIVHRPSSPTILFIGQLVPRKGFDVLARAMPAVARQFPTASFVFVSHNRQSEAELRQLVAEGGVESHMQLLGSVSEDEKVRLLREADVVVAPSRYEGFGIPIIEGMAAGRPVVTTDVPAGNELVDHERTGLLVPYNDHHALAAAIVRVLNDRALAERLGAAGRAAVRERYGADRLAADLEAWYQSFVT
ncbi:MAG TPA: glycosyltransferase family 4 protein [Roseiflexaceae bacterium]|nr:glycosyltransferase family 4 protein [Roseiflexaceae bacterium]